MVKSKRGRRSDNEDKTDIADKTTTAGISSSKTALISRNENNNPLPSESLEQYQWSLGHLYPDIYEPVRFPDQYQFPTHIMRSPFQRTLTIPSTRDFVVYFAPAVDCFYNYQLNKPAQPYHNLNVNWSEECYLSYADNNSMRTDQATDNKCVFKNVTDGIFNDLGSWNYSRMGSTSLGKFKKVRLIGAYLRITYTGKAEDKSGTVRVAMGVRNFTSSLSSDGVSVDDLINMPQFKTLTLDEPIVCRYRVTNDDFMDFGPYSPYISVPYFLIYGKGLQEGSSVFVETLKYYEGVVIPEEEEFVSPMRANRNQFPIMSQMELVKKHGHQGSIDVHRKISEQEMDNMTRYTI